MITVSLDLSFRVTFAGVEFIILREVVRVVINQTVDPSFVWGFNSGRWQHCIVGVQAAREISGLLSPDRLHYDGFRGLDLSRTRVHVCRFISMVLTIPQRVDGTLLLRM